MLLDQWIGSFQIKPHFSTYSLRLEWVVVQVLRELKSQPFHILQICQGASRFSGCIPQMSINGDLSPFNYVVERLEEDISASPCCPPQKPLQTPLSNLAGATDLSFVTELNRGPELMAVSQPQAAYGWGMIGPPPCHFSPCSNDHFVMDNNTSLCKGCSLCEVEKK